MDIEFLAAFLRTFTDIIRHGRHIILLETVLVSVYYPSASSSSSGEDPEGYKHWSREAWLPRPRAHTPNGYAHSQVYPSGQ